jgi:hypothetical protein
MRDGTIFPNNFNLILPRPVPVAKIIRFAVTPNQFYKPAIPS